MTQGVWSLVAIRRMKPTGPRLLPLPDQLAPFPRRSVRSMAVASVRASLDLDAQSKRVSDLAKIADKSKAISDALDATRGAFKDGMSTLVDDLRKGSDALTIASDVSGKIADKAIDYTLDLMTKSLFGSGIERRRVRERDREPGWQRQRGSEQY